MGFQDWSWILGAGLAILGSVCSNFGVNIQKYSFMKNALKPKNEQLPYHQQSGWLIGLGLIVFGSFGDFVALMFAAQSIVAPMGSVTLVANIFFAHFWLGEQLERVDMIGTSLILLGSLVTVLFGDHSSEIYTLHDLKLFYNTLSFALYAIITSAFGLILYIIAKSVEPKKIHLLETIVRYEAAAEVQSSVKDLMQLDTEISEAEEAYKPYEKIHPFCYCAISGMCGAQNILFGKMVAVLLAQTIDGNSQLGYFLTYVFVAAMFASILIELHFLAKALTWFDALYVVPVFQCFWVGTSLVGGAAYFQEFADFSSWQFFFFPLGIIIELLGVFVLSQRTMSAERKTRSYSRIARISINTDDTDYQRLDNDDINTSDSIPIENPKKQRLRATSASKYVRHRGDHSDDEGVLSRPRSPHGGSLLDWDPAVGLLTPHFDIAAAEMEAHLGKQHAMTAVLHQNKRDSHTGLTIEQKELLKNPIDEEDN